MPVRRRQDKRVNRAYFDVTPEMIDAFRAYIASEPNGGAAWKEHWRLHDLLADADVLETPFCPPCCWHPRDASAWEHCPEAVAIFNRLDAVSRSRNAD